MRKFQLILSRYRLPMASLTSFLAGMLCVACYQGYQGHQGLSATRPQWTSQTPGGNGSSFNSADKKAPTDAADIAALENENKETPAEFTVTTETESAITTDAETNATISSGTNESEDAAPTATAKGQPFWQADDSESISDSLNLSGYLNIEPENSPLISDATPDRILSDFQGRINSDFEVPELIFNQTKFWFRVYTEFDSNKKIIHDSLHPHIIFDVVDVSDTLAQPTRAQWLNVVKAQKQVANRVSEIRNQLKKMARKKKEDMNPQELAWLAQFEGIRGNPKKVILQSAQSLRVQTGQKDFFENALATSGRYLDGMESIFKSKGLPIELTRLPFVESSFVIGATSKVGAAGIWQFMPGVGRQFMRVNDQVDERRSPWKATEAAAKLLKENYIILHKHWGLALTAYNHGPGGVRKAMQATGSKDIAQIVRRYRSKSFDFASANFYTCFLAAVHAQMYRDLIFPDRTLEAPLAYDSIHLKKSFKPRQLVQWTGLTDEQILLYNPELDRSFKRNYVIPKGYRLFLPSEAKMSLQKVVSNHGDNKTSSSSLE
jgi:membrane-bound lytic murein transglycosylase D